MSILPRHAQTTQAVQAVQGNPIPASLPAQPVRLPSLGSSVELQRWGREVARRLPMSCCRVLADVATTTLHGDAPFVPPSAEDMRATEQLSQASGAPLLQSESAGYVLAYRLTPYGAAVVAAFLGDYLMGRAIPPLAPLSSPAPAPATHAQRAHEAVPGAGGQHGWYW